MTRRLALVLSAILLVAACGDDDSTDAETTDSTTTTTESPTSSTQADGTTTTTTLPGEPIDIFPYAGAELVVVGIAASDELTVHAGPGDEFGIVDALTPVATGLVATGENRIVGDEIWVRIDTNGIVGWANSRFVLQPGAVDDVTAAMYPTPGDRPSADDMVALAQVVGGDAASVEPRSLITVVDGPTFGDLADVIVDVIGLGDDSIGGLRLHIFATDDDGTYTVRTIEQTTLCSRGVSDEGLCA